MLSLRKVIAYSSRKNQTFSMNVNMMRAEGEFIMTDVDLLAQRARKQAALAEAGLLKKPPLQELRSFVDHTLLKPGYSDENIISLCKEAISFGFASVCLPSLAVPLAVECLAGTKVRVTAAVGFPFGASPIATKISEILFALERGAHEIDVVLHLSNIKGNRKRELQEELATLRRETRGKVLNVVVETSQLSYEEIIQSTPARIPCGSGFHQKRHRLFRQSPFSST